MNFSKLILFFILSFKVVLFFGCSALTKLNPVESKMLSDMNTYKYALIENTQSINSSIGVGNGYILGAQGYSGYYSVSKSINPSDVIAGILMKKGYTIVSDVKHSDRTFLVKFGQSGRRSVGLGGYTLEVTIQFISTQTNDLLFTCTAEGIGDTEADDIRVAINRCLESF